MNSIAKDKSLFLFDNLSDKDVRRLHHASVLIQKNLEKYLVEKFFSDMPYRDEWDNVSREEIRTRIHNGYKLFYVSDKKTYKEIFIQDNVGYKFIVVIWKGIQWGNL